MQSAIKPSSSLIITLAPAEDRLHYFTSLRNTYYPKYCNHLPAHLTMLHRLPPALPLVHDGLAQLANRPPVEVEVTGIENLGNGVAYTLAGSELLILHKAMQDYFNPYLISRDRRNWQPHITVQNKVTAYKARQTTAFLLQHFKPFSFMTTGISTWCYLKGLWQLNQFYPFGTD